MEWRYKMDYGTKELYKLLNKLDKMTSKEYISLYEKINFLEDYYEFNIIIDSINNELTYTNNNILKVVDLYKEIKNEKIETLNNDNNYLMSDEPLAA